MAVQEGLLQQEIEGFRERIAQGESVAFNRIATDWKRAYRHIEGELLVLQQEIQLLRDAGQDVPVSWLVNNRQYQKVLETAEREIERFAGSQLEETIRLRRQAILDGLTDADALKQVVATGTSVDKLAATMGYDESSAKNLLSILAKNNPGELADFVTGPTALGGGFAGAFEASVGSLEPGSPLRELFAEWGEDGAKQARFTLLKHVALASGPRETAKEFQRSLEHVSATRARTIARTEQIRAYREANRASYIADPNLSGWVWLSAADSRTCPSCWAMHGSEHALTERLDDHPNGRCSMVPLIHGHTAESLGIERGEDLFKKLPEDEQIAILGPKRHQHWKSGKIGFGENVIQIENATWGSMRTTRSLKAMGFTGKKKLRRQKPKTPKAAEPTLPKDPIPDRLGPAPSPSRLRNLVGADGTGDEMSHRRKLSKWIHQGPGGSSNTGAKKHVMQTLGDRLKKSKRVSLEDVQGLKDEMIRLGQNGFFGYGDDVYEEVATTLLSTWAQTASDNNPWSFAMQRAAHKEFGLSDEGLNWLKDFDKKAWDDAGKILAGNGGRNEEVFRTVLRGMYDETQEVLAASGIETVSLMRGIRAHGRVNSTSTAHNIVIEQRDDIMLNPMSSFSTNFETHRFFRQDRSIVMEVPRERIIGCPRTGFGCLNEYEFVVLGPHHGEAYVGHVWDGLNDNTINFWRSRVTDAASGGQDSGLALAQERMIERGIRKKELNPLDPLEGLN